MAPRAAVLYVEDPGAANFVAPLVASLAALGLAPRLFAEGAATGQLAAMGVSFEDAAAAWVALAGAAVLVVGTGENRESRAHRLVRTARAQGVATLGAVDAPSSAGERFRAAGDPLALAPDWLLVPDAATRDAFVALGHPAARTVEVGHPYYDSVAARRASLDRVGRDALRRRHFPDAPASAPVVVFLAELSDGLDPAAFLRAADYTLAGWGDDDRRTHVVLQEVMDALAAREPAPYVVLRLHPKNAVVEFARYGDAVRRISRDEPALEIVYAADLVIGMTTMLLAEAAILGRPVLSVLPRASERGWLPAAIGPQLPVVTRRAEIGPAIDRLLAAPAPIVPPAPGAASRAAAAIARAAGVRAMAAPC